MPVRPRLDLRTPALREFLRLMLPKMVSQPIEPLTFLFFTHIATTLAAGSVTAVSFARNFQSVPVALVGVPISLAAFPALSAAWAANDRQGFSRLRSARALLTIGVLTVAAAIRLVVVGPLAIEVLLGGGAFDAEDVALTAAVLAAFALAVPFDALGHLLARACTRPTTRCCRSSRRSPGSRSRSWSRCCSWSRVGVLAIPLGFAAGTAVRTRAQGHAARATAASSRPRRPRGPGRPDRARSPASGVQRNRRHDGEEQPVAARGSWPSGRFHGR